MGFSHQSSLFPPGNRFKDRISDAFLRSVPHQPGVYIMLDDGGSILYVGKAVDLRKRLSSYVHAHADSVPRKVMRLLQLVASVRYEVCSDEAGALMRENFLIRNYDPPYNQVNTRTFTYACIGFALRPNGMSFDWQLEPYRTDDTLTWYGAFKSRRQSRQAYRALLRVLWAFAHEPQGMHDLPVFLMGPRFPRQGLIEHERMDATLHDALDEWFSGRPEQLEDAVDDWLNRLPEPSCTALHRFLFSEWEAVLQFYERAVEPLCTLRAMLPETPTTIPQEKIDDLIVLSKLLPYDKPH
ncbi:MAG: putative GIY-YIG superfamily endonuclease [Kiritimatiellia bacterium]|jgi:predicted GIY-YIG superfamily endonuclease